MKHGPTLHKSMQLPSVAFVHTPDQASEIENPKVGPKERANRLKVGKSKSNR